jgi:hyperosmotically inducible protein
LLRSIRIVAPAALHPTQQENTMKHSRHFAVIALAVAVSFGLSTGVALAAQQAAPTTDHSSSAGQAVSDAWITTKVKSELATTKGVKSMDVTVKTVDGVVTLTGVLDTENAVNKAIAVAKSVKGVKDVDASGLKSKD